MPEKPFKGYYLKVTHTFDDALVYLNSTSNYTYRDIKVSYLCFVTRLPNYQKIMKVDGILGLAPVIEDKKDYSFVYQIKKMLKVD